MMAMALLLCWKPANLQTKHILRFSETKESEKSEYVLAGTLVSIAIAVACGILVLATR